MVNSIFWQWSRFQDLTPREQYEMHRARQQVFAVEQNCVYLDADGYDLNAWHLLGWADSRHTELAAYLRVIPSIQDSYVKIGRVLTAPQHRGKGLGQLLMKQAQEKIISTFGQITIKMSAQAYLETFYQKFGYDKEGDPYLEDGIPHILMVKKN